MPFKINSKLPKNMLVINKLLALDFLKDANDDSVVELSEDEEKKDPADFGNHLTTFLIQ
jgi:hypothetical protein